MSVRGHIWPHLLNRSRRWRRCLSSRFPSFPRPRRSFNGFPTLHYFALIVFFVLLSFLVGFLVASTAGILAAAPGWDLWVMVLPAFLFSWAVPVVVAVDGSLHLYLTAGAAAIVVASFVWALLSPRDGFLRPLLSGERRMWRLGALESVGMSYMAAVSMNVVWVILIFAAGWVPQTPAQIPTWSPEHIAEALFFASVWEEASVKLTMISLPLLVAHLIGRKLLPSQRYLLGGHIEFDRLAGFLMIVSAAVFGYLHVIGGWDWTKFPPAFVFGMFTGYLFLRFGLYAAILLHFANNFLIVPVLLAGRPSLDTAITLVLLFFVMIGLVYWSLLVRTIVRTIRATKSAMDASGSTGVGSATGGPFVVGRFMSARLEVVEPTPKPSAGEWGGSPTDGELPDGSAGPVMPPAGPIAPGAGNRDPSSPAWAAALSQRSRRPHDPYACALCGSREYRFHGGELECIGCGAVHGRDSPGVGAPRIPDAAPPQKDIMEI